MEMEETAVPIEKNECVDVSQKETPEAKCAKKIMEDRETEHRFLGRSRTLFSANGFPGLETHLLQPSRIAGQHFVAFRLLTCCR